MTYSIYELIDKADSNTPTNFKKKAMIAYLLTAPPLITKEMVEKLLKNDKGERDD